MPYALIQRRSARSPTCQPERGSSRSACYRPRSGDERLPPGNQWSPPAARLCAVNVTELAPAHATPIAGHSTRSSSSSARRSAQSSMASTLGVRGSRRRFLPVRSFCRSCRAWTSALVAPTVGRDALVRHPDVLWQPSRMPKHVYRYAAARVPVTANTKPFRLDQFE